MSSDANSQPFGSWETNASKAHSICLTIIRFAINTKLSVISIISKEPKVVVIALNSLTPVHTSTLTPMHLRKAKLMFFFVRYPSSAILKMFFPDIKFNKNNTAQLVKWFSNFR